MQRSVWAFAAVLATASGANARSAAVTSWGKPNIGFDQYQADAVECGTLGYYRDVSEDEPAKRFIRGWRTADDNLNRAGGEGPQAADDWSDSIRRTQPARRMREVHAIQVGDVERCLMGKGYAAFILTADEQRRLSKLPRGSLVRKQYLHELAARER